MARLVSTLLVLAALGWAALCAYAAATGWPRMPLDVPAGDPAVRTAFDRAVTQHILQYALVGLLPLVAALVLRTIVGRRS